MGFFGCRFTFSSDDRSATTWAYSDLNCIHSGFRFGFRGLVEGATHTSIAGPEEAWSVVLVVVVVVVVVVVSSSSSSSGKGAMKSSSLSSTSNAGEPPLDGSGSLLSTDGLI